MVTASEAIRLRRCEAGNRVVEAATRVLEESVYFRGRSQLIQIHEDDGVLSLRGRLPSYYLKQLLQTALRDVDGVEQIDNQVDVD